MENNRAMDLAWLAGIVDGEGSIFIMRQKRKDRVRNHNYILRVSVQSTDAIMARECLKITGEGYAYDAVTYKENQSNTYKWMVQGRDAMKVLEEISPYLRVKKNQAEAAIEFHKTTKKHWRKMTEEDYVAQKDFYFKLKQQKVDLKIGRNTFGYITANTVIVEQSIH